MTGFEFWSVWEALSVINKAFLLLSRGISVYSLALSLHSLFVVRSLKAEQQISNTRLGAICRRLSNLRQKKHFLRIAYHDESKTPQVAIFEAPKKTPLILLAILRQRAPQGCKPQPYVKCPQMRFDDKLVSQDPFQFLAASPLGSAFSSRSTCNQTSFPNLSHVLFRYPFTGHPR